MIVAAAAARFARVGYPSTTVADVATDAGVSTGNVYRYFEGKERLLDAVVPRAFASELRTRIRARIEALGAERDVRTLPPDAPYHLVSQELLELCIENRERVVILLGQGQGTPFEGYAAELASELVTWALAYARKAWPKLRPSEELRFALSRIYAAYVASLADALATFAEPARIRAAVHHLSTHHLGGLRHLFEEGARHVPEHHDPDADPPTGASARTPARRAGSRAAHSADGSSRAPTSRRGGRARGRG